MRFFGPACCQRLFFPGSPVITTPQLVTGCDLDYAEPSATLRPALILRSAHSRSRAALVSPGARAARPDYSSTDLTGLRAGNSPAQFYGPTSYETTASIPGTQLQLPLVRWTLPLAHLPARCTTCPVFRLPFFAADLALTFHTAVTCVPGFYRFCRDCLTTRWFITAPRRCAAGLTPRTLVWVSHHSWFCLRLLHTVLHGSGRHAVLVLITTAHSIHTAVRFDVTQPRAAAVPLDLGNIHTAHRAKHDAALVHQNHTTCYRLPSPTVHITQFCVTTQFCRACRIAATNSSPDRGGRHCAGQPPLTAGPQRPQPGSFTARLGLWTSRPLLRPVLLYILTTILRGSSGRSWQPCPGSSRLRRRLHVAYRVPFDIL